ncbi:uncharacterized protein LOC126381069 [Pectinophora gossypiella]|uniref:uncharacterized protein LOC126381069 n=1 Tax=Pectinophora gossypiella TaxID=13191 RepID=UPI00214E2681|nr:uncharacterized protein LOC126381069 [Pectinophora gossypiella]
MRAALKEDLQCSAAELVYGEPLRLPGELISPAEPNQDRFEDLQSFATQLRRNMARLRPIAASRHGQQSIFVPKDLSTASHIFLRDDTVRPSLRPPYTGPYKVVSRRDKTITITIGDKNVQVSVDRVKPAYILDIPTSPATRVPIAHSPATSEPVPAAPVMPAAPTAPPVSPAPTVRPTPTDNSKPQYTTRSGRNVRFKDRLDL